jgi:GTP-binding protein
MSAAAPVSSQPARRPRAQAPTDGGAESLSSYAPDDVASDPRLAEAPGEQCLTQESGSVDETTGAAPKVPDKQSAPSFDQAGGQADADDGRRAEEARKLFAGRVEFLLSAPSLKFLPKPDVPEIALCGRSNVGKSSLINALTGRRSIARRSVTPGRTQELNFFEVGQPTRFRLVDMPGYGFAKAPAKIVERWQALVRTYLRGRAVLKRTLLLVDSRHGLMPADHAMMALLDEAAIGYRIVLTKADKVNRDALARCHDAVQTAARRHAAAHPQIHVTSAEKGLGIADLRSAVSIDLSP